MRPLLGAAHSQWLYHRHFKRPQRIIVLLDRVFSRAKPVIAESITTLAVSIDADRNETRGTTDPLKAHQGARSPN